MAKIKIVQIVVATSDGEWSTQYLDDKGRVWQERLVLDDAHTKYDELYRPTNKVYKSVIEQVVLPEEPTDEQPNIQPSSH